MLCIGSSLHILHVAYATVASPLKFCLKVNIFSKISKHMSLFWFKTNWGIYVNMLLLIPFHFFRILRLSENKQKKNEKKLLCTKISHVHVLLNVFIDGTEALFATKNYFQMHASKKSALCELSQALTPSIQFLLLLKSCYLNQLFKEVNRC
jgi:hypothetical protein